MQASQKDIAASQPQVQCQKKLVSKKESRLILLDSSRRLLLDHLDKIFASKIFAKSEFLKRFLRFVVAKVLRLEEDEIKEYSLATEVFGRDDAFDPRIDSIVRVQAHHLRAKLKNYYQTEGHHDQLRIEIPRGSYIPVLSYLKTSHVSIKAVLCKSSPWCRVAVLPFLDLGEEATMDHSLGDAITETIIDDLTLAGTLEVIARVPSFKSKQRHRDMQYIGKQLKLDALLEGSIQRSKNLLRVKARLVDVSTGCAVWSTTFDLKCRDRLAVQEQISNAIVPSVVALMTSSHDQARIADAVGWSR